jgi:OmpA family
MLKYSLFGFLGLLCAAPAQAQTPLSVYFSPNQHQLQKADIARLDSLTKTLPADGIWRLEIKAYTDDRGSAETNKQLAERRAQAVDAYFSKYKHSIGESKLDPIGEVAIAALADNQLETQRQQARRVDIYVQTAEKAITFSAPNNTPTKASATATKYKDMNDFWTQVRAKSDIAQNFTQVNPAEPFTIYGKKGSRLEIPQDAFVVKVSKGKPKAPISFELREAYTFGDMILQGLTTTSDSNLLQTGGMIYINAKDADGQDLELSPEKQIAWTFPSQNALPTGMQIFTAAHNTPHHPDQVTNHSTGINWQANAQQFSTRFPNRGGEIGIEQEPSLSYLQKPISTWSVSTARIRDNKDYKTINTPILTPPLLEDSTLISSAAMRKYPKKTTESETQYQARIMQIHRTSQETYDYAVETMGFMLTEEVFDKIEIRFTGLEKFISLTDILKRLKYVVTTYKLDSFQSALKKFEKYTQNDPAVQLATDLATDCSLSGISATQTEFLKELLEVCTVYNSDGSKKYQFIHDKVQRWYAKKHPTKYKDLVAFSLELNKILTNKLFWVSTKNMQDSYNSLCKLQTANGSQIDNSVFANINPQLRELEKLRQDIFSSDLWKKALIKAEQEAKLNQTFANTANLNGLGWVNCDRFANYTDLMYVNIPLPDQASSQYYLIIPEDKVIVCLETDSKSIHSPKAYKGLPASKKARLIGLRLNEGVVEICEHQARISEFSKAKLTFVPSTEEALKSTLAKL